MKLHIVLFILMSLAVSACFSQNSKSKIIFTKRVLLNFKGQPDSLLIPVASLKYPALRDSLSNKVFWGENPDSLIKTYQTEGFGINAMDYTISFENRAVLSIAVHYETTGGSYPDSYWEYFNFNISSGNEIKLSQLVTRAGLKWVLKQYVPLLKRRIMQDQKERARYANPNLQEKQDEAEVYHDLIESLPQIDTETISNSYYLTPKGIIFTSNDTLGHAYRALEPDRSIFFTYRQLKPYLTTQANNLFK